MVQHSDVHTAEKKWFEKQQFEEYKMKETIWQQYLIPNVMGDVGLTCQTGVL